MLETTALTDAIEARTRLFPDFPKPGIQFQDLTPVFGQPSLVRRVAEAFTGAFQGEFDQVLAVEARGFILGTAVAMVSDRPLALARKTNKLPGPVHRVDYALEYGTATLEMQKDTLVPGERVLVVDDVLATGGTLAAARELILGGDAVVAGYAVVTAIPELRGEARLAPEEVFSLLSASG